MVHFRPHEQNTVGKKGETSAIRLNYAYELVMERVSKNPTKTRPGPDFLKPEPEPDFSS